MSANFELATRVGRLIEARVYRLATREDADDYSRALADEVRRHHRAPILLADHRPVRIYPQAPADRLVELFVDMNSRLERIAILVAPTNATILMQLERISREASYANRKVFRETEPALEHLALSLDAGELERARAFLAEARSRSGSP